LASTLLAPFGDLAAFLAESRFKSRQPYRSRLPVICVGNFTAGGTGKTPLALFIMDYLKGRGESPVCLTRGYGGRAAGPAWVDPATHTAREVGDEPLLLARAGPVLVARDRTAGVKAIESGGAPASLIVMDDGMQNPAIAKDLVIAVVDGERGLGNGRVIPAGPLRARLEFQTGLADCIVVNGRGGETGSQGRVLESLKRSFPGPVLAARAEPAADTSWLGAAPVVAYAGIGHPERFCFPTSEPMCWRAGLSAIIMPSVPATQTSSWTSPGPAAPSLSLPKRTGRGSPARRASSASFARPRGHYRSGSPSTSATRCAWRRSSMPW
jgi:tetraacyldisaccharide 4'-kinase